MPRVLSAMFILLLATACSRDAAETRNPGGNPPAPLAGSSATSPDNTDTTALGTVGTATATTQTAVSTTDTTATWTDPGAPRP